MTILHIDSAITGDASVSRALGKAVVERLQSVDPGSTIVYRDVAADPIPHLTLESDATSDSAILEEFLAAQTVVVGAPLYNFGVPSQLKAWIDRILVAGRTFSYSADGPKGLVGHIRVIVAVARGGFYQASSPFREREHDERYLRTIFNFIGIEPEFVEADGIMVSPEQKAQAIDGANERIATLAV